MYVPGISSSERLAVFWLCTFADGFPWLAIYRASELELTLIRRLSGLHFHRKYGSKLLASPKERDTSPLKMTLADRDKQDVENDRF